MRRKIRVEMHVDDRQLLLRERSARNRGEQQDEDAANGQYSQCNLTFRANSRLATMRREPLSLERREEAGRKFLGRAPLHQVRRVYRCAPATALHARERTLLA